MTRPRIFLFLLAFLLLAFGPAMAGRTSYTNTLRLDTQFFPAPQGLDIWLSRDGGKSWELVGRTSGAGQAFTYTASGGGHHSFHFHARQGEEDYYKPGSGAEAHQSFDVVHEGANERILYSNSRKFSIEYKTRDVVSEIVETRLYYTLDSGGNWRYYGNDPDRRSPMTFAATGDGLYGFKVMSIDRAGIKEAEPAPGVLPDILVRVDTVAPQVSLLSPQPNEIWESGSVRNVQWVADDEAMDPSSCVSLFCSVGAATAWREVARNLPASGSLSWTVPESENGRVFVQARAVDRAGNTGRSGEAGPFFTRNILEELLGRDVRDQANRYYETATVCRKNGDFPKAVKYYRLCLQLNPYHVRCHNDIGLTLNEMGRPNEAVPHFELGLKYSPSHEGIMCSLGRLCLEQRQCDAARQILVRLVNLHPTSIKGLWLSSNEACMRGDFERARAYWKRIIDLDVSPDVPDFSFVKEARKRLFDTEAGKKG